ncbi:MAG: hypothetical protein Q4P66_05555 [Actinomycetaceae bacterium]|nr:hypothetical protein [Actinomycetaceae bacterium]
MSHTVQHPADKATLTQTNTTSQTSTAGDLFTTADRCDACGAQAWVRAYMESGELLFCSHHARQFSDVLTNLTVDDARDQLFAEEKASSIH